MLRLITMPPSHFAEKARWALDLSGLQYVEERHAPLFHRFALARVGAGTTVPALVTEKETLKDSESILRWVDRRSQLNLYPEPAVEELEKDLDARFGPAIPRWAYFHLIPRRALYTRVCTEGAPGKERLGFGLLAPLAGLGMKKGLKINQAACERAVGRITEYFDKIGAMLSDGRRYLFGDAFTAADLTWAALASLPCGAQGYRGSRLALEEMPPAMRAQTESWAATPAGQFVQRIYSEHRGA